MNDNIKESRPVFDEILDALKEQLSYMDENSSIILEKVSIIKDIREEKEGINDGCINPNCVIDELWSCVDRMKIYNSKLNQSKKALVKFVG